MKTIVKYIISIFYSLIVVSALSQNYDPVMVEVIGGTAYLTYFDTPVTINNFKIGKYEITQKQWEDVMKTIPEYASDQYLGDNPSEKFGLGDNYPAYYVSWDDIVYIFLPRLNELTGKNYRLPTEAEYEYAARGGQQSQNYMYAGSNNTDDVSWFWYNRVYGTGDGKWGPKPVGTKNPNELGIYDMSGNVYEWCYDTFLTYSEGVLPYPNGIDNPVNYGDGISRWRVMRGGSWAYDGIATRTRCRYTCESYARSAIFGFRVVLDDKSPLILYDGETVNPTWVTVSGETVTNNTDNPDNTSINTSAKCVKVERNFQHGFFAGAKIPVSLNHSSFKMVSIMLHKTVAGNVKIQFEEPGNPINFWLSDAVYHHGNGWQTLVFNTTANTVQQISTFLVFVHADETIGNPTFGTKNMYIDNVKVY